MRTRIALLIIGQVATVVFMCVYTGLTVWLIAQSVTWSVYFPLAALPILTVLVATGMYRAGVTDALFYSALAQAQAQADADAQEDENAEVVRQALNGKTSTRRT